MSSLERILKPSFWALYAIIVFEILFMISPFALYFYSVYAPVLDFFDQWAGTAWLTQFFLPHISKTTSPLLNLLHGLAWPLILIGTGLFLGSAFPLYWVKFRRQGAVTTGLYAFIRHPQYVGLALLGLGTLLLWPRFLVLITYITMLFLYGLLARWEEAQCLAQYGESYRAYQARTGRFLPLALSRRIPRLLPPSARGEVPSPPWGSLCCSSVQAWPWASPCATIHSRASRPSIPQRPLCSRPPSCAMTN